jgi:hypothetical protein
MKDLKPGDLFFGLMEFLAFIVPGFFLTVTLPKIIEYAPLKSIDITGEKTTTFSWFAFVMISYILGHFLHHICAMILNPIYEVTYLKIKLKKHETFIVKSEEIIEEKLPLKTDSVKAAEAYLRINNPNVLPELERHEANSKLFRSICLLSIYLCFILELNATIFLIVISFLSFTKFANERWTHRYLIYQFFLISVKVN